jgi:hypothetical protein
MKKYILPVFAGLLMLLSMVFSGCSDDDQNLNDYIIAGETTPEQTAHYTFDASLTDLNSDTSISLDLNADGTDDLKLMNQSFESDSIFVRRIGIKALGNLQLAQEINPSDSLHFADTVSDLYYEQGAIIDENHPWQPAGHEIMLEHRLIMTTEEDDHTTTTNTRRVSVSDSSVPYIGFRLYIDNRYHYGWIKFIRSQDSNSTTISISEAAITQVYSD